MPSQPRFRRTASGSPPPSGTAAVASTSWDAATGDKLFTLDGLNSGASCLAFSTDGKRIAGVGNVDAGLLVEASIRTVDLKAKKVTHAFKGSGEVTAVAFSPDGDRLVSVGQVSDTLA